LVLLKLPVTEVEVKGGFTVSVIYSLVLNLWFCWLASVDLNGV